MIAKVVFATIFCACVTAQKYEASSYTSFSSHHDDHHESSYQHVPTLIKKVVPVATYHHAAPVATYHHAAPVASYHHAAPVASYHHPAPVATYHHAAPVAVHHAAPVVVHHAAPVATYHHAAPVAIKAAPVLLKTAPVAYHAPAIIKAPVAVHHHHHEEEYEHAPRHYAFQYGVKDTHTGDIHNQHEEADDHVVKGEYSLVQPDGITRTVHYTADKDGFNAQVEYSGHASHPQVHQKVAVVKPVIVAKPVAVVAPVYKKVVAVPLHHGYQHHH